MEKEDTDMLCCK